MLREARATKYVYDASHDALEIATGASPGGKSLVDNATLLLDAKKSLVGIDLRATEADVVVMLGGHEDVVEQVEGEVRIELSPDGEIARVRVDKASRAITNPAKNSYV